MMLRRGNHQLILAIWLYSLLTLAFVSCLPNIRIQVNNENIQNAPYLLEALKQVAASSDVPLIEHGAPITTKDTVAKLSSQNSSWPTELAANKIKESSGNNRASGTNNNNNKTIESEESKYDENEPHNFSLIKEETIEEILDLEPESILKLSPESLMGVIPSAEYNKVADLASASDASSSQEYASSAESNKPANEFMGPQKTTDDTGHINRKPQLPVTNAHLKKPASINDSEQQQQASASESLMLNGTLIGGGAKSLVSASVASDEPPALSSSLNKKAASPPDTLELSQIMSGVSNASEVPLTVNREYGHQTRTRITIGGGYVRDRLPPLVEPSSSLFKDDKPEKPVAPLERPRPLSSSSIVKPVEIKRVIEVPERIVLPDDALDKPTSIELPTNSNGNNSKLPNDSKKKRDSRCPKHGITTIEHPSACDKYFYCEDGYLSEQTCPNGLMYGTRDIIRDFCVHRWKAVCDDKSIPNPISSPGCRWQYGIFSVQGSPKCSPDFYECTEGKFEVKKCSIDGQVYDERTKSCRFAETVGCANEALADFHCPPDDQANTYWPFPRYFLNERSLIHCVNDKPEIVRCTDDERVDPEHLHCVPFKKLTTGTATETRKARERKKPANS